MISNRNSHSSKNHPNSYASYRSSVSSSYDEHSSIQQNYYVQDADKVSSTNTFSSSSMNIHDFYYHQIHELEKRIEQLEEKSSNLEKNVTEKQYLLKKTDSLFKLFYFILIVTPLCLMCAMAIVQYYFYKDNNLLSFVTSIIGLASLFDCFCVPSMLKNTLERIDKIEAKLDK